MYKFTGIVFLFIAFSLEPEAQNTLPSVILGKIERIENLKSQYVSPRNIDIWVPENYSASKKYAVLYMHDGQMLFDSNNVWNKQSWNIDDVASDLFLANKVKDFIVVGIWNSGQSRHSEYFPQQPFERLPQLAKDTLVAQLQNAGRTKATFRPASDNYLKFITSELKPYIDKTYSVKTNRENTFVAGSSMGGLISLYAICEYPRIFGGAACLSTHWIGSFSLANNPVPNSFLSYLNKNLPNHKNHKIYFDCGDQTLDALYPEIQNKVDTIMKSKGFTATNWVTKYFPGDDHSEKSWSKRLHIPIEFLLKK